MYNEYVYIYVQNKSYNYLLILKVLTPKNYWNYYCNSMSQWKPQLKPQLIKSFPSINSLKWDNRKMRILKIVMQLFLSKLRMYKTFQRCN